MSKEKWDTSDIPSQQGRVAIVTGSTSGIGKETARVLASKGASVIVAARNIPKGESVVKAIKAASPNADITVRELDLSSLVSIKAFSDGILKDFQQLDILINNAGIMMCPYSKTKDGFEMQMGTNHLGHFALTGHLLPLMKQTPKSRLVILSSVGHRGGEIDFSDFNWETRKYKTIQAYGDSKLANLYFAYELKRKLANDDNAPRVTAAHPGWTETELQRHSGALSFLNRFFAQGTDMGALPTLRAAIDDTAKSGDYFGPGRFFEMHGNPIQVKSNDRSHEQDTARKLWELSEKMTGIAY